MGASVVPGPGYILDCMVKPPKTKLERLNADLKMAGCGTQILEGEIEIMDERTNKAHYSIHYWGGRFKRKGMGWATLYCVLNVSSGIGSVIYTGPKARGIIDRILNARKLAEAKKEAENEKVAAE